MLGFFLLIIFIKGLGFLAWSAITPGLFGYVGLVGGILMKIIGVLIAYFAWKYKESTHKKRWGWRDLNPRHAGFPALVAPEDNHPTRVTILF
jgi:hypothetical protein